MVASAVVVVVVVVNGGDVGGGDVSLMEFFVGRTFRNAQVVCRSSIGVLYLRRSPSLLGLSYFNVYGIT